jgi:hypothetical protein
MDGRNDETRRPDVPDKPEMISCAVEWDDWWPTATILTDGWDHIQLPKELVDRYRETQRAYGKALLELQEYVEKHHPEHRP